MTGVAARRGGLSLLRYCMVGKTQLGVRVSMSSVKSESGTSSEAVSGTQVSFVSVLSVDVM